MADFVKSPEGAGRSGPGARGPWRGGRRGRPSGETEILGADGQPSAELSEKVVFINRSAKVVKGGRRFNFSALIVVGDKKGRVGVGLGKAADTALAIEKAMRAAKRNMISLPLTKNRSIRHNVDAKYCASIVEIRPSPGRGASLERWSQLAERAET